LQWWEIVFSRELRGNMEGENLQTIKRLERKLAEAKVRIEQLETQLGPNSSKALVNDVFEFHLDVVLYLDAHTGDILWGNQAASRFYGYTRSELTSMHISNINIMSREEAAMAMKQVRERTRCRFLFTHRMKSGELKNIEVYSVPMVLEGREILCSFIRDLTGVTDVETLAEKSEAMQDQVLTSMDMIPFYCRNKGAREIIYVGASVGVVTGFPVERFYGSPTFWESRIHPEDREKVAGRFNRLEDTLSTRCEFRWRVASGNWRWFALSMRLVCCDGVDGTPDSCVAGLIWDITSRKRTEKNLLEREERYRTIADFTHDWEFWIGPDGSFLYVSPSFERVTGYKPTELKANPDLLFDTIVHPMDREIVRGTVLGGLRSESRLAFDFRIVTRSGEVRWIGHVSQAVYDDKGDPMGRRASNRDITGLKETVQALKDKNKFIDSIMDNCPATIYAKDVDGRYLFGNARFVEYAGKHSHEILGKTDFGLFRNEVAELFRQGDMTVLETGESLFEEVSLVKEHGTEHWTSSKFPLINSEGQSLGVCGISLDVTEWREAEAHLRQLALAVEQSPVSIAMTDTAGRITSVNPCFCDKSGYDEADVLGRKLGFMLADEDERFYDRVWDTVREGGEWQGDVRNRRNGGEIIWERCSISSVRDSQEDIVNFVVVKDDITERKRLERLEQDVERIVRHDLKSPIMSFIWVPRTLRKADNLTKKQSMLLEDMEQSAHRLLRMVNLSQDIFKMEEGSYEFSPEDLNVLRVVQNVLHDLGSTLKALKVRVDVQVDGKPVVEGDCLLVRGEELLTHSMLSNLIKNAVEASNAKDIVSVDCRQGSDYTIIRVHNPSVVAEDIRDTFFDKYATSGKKFGTGLGTYSARLIAETQGGYVHMESDRERGTSVSVTFPAQPACENSSV